MNQTVTPMSAPRMATKPQIIIAGIRARHAFADADMARSIPAQWQRAMPDLQRMNAGHSAYGLSFGMCSGGAHFDYLAGVEVADDTALPEGWVASQLPAHDVAIFAHDGPLSTISATCGAILSGWLPQSGYRLADNDALPDLIEYYGPKFDPQTGTGDIEIWLPVTR